MAIDLSEVTTDSTDGGEAPVSPSPSPETGAAAAAGATPSTLDDGAPAVTAGGEQLYDVKINGRVQKVPLSELMAGYSRQQDYTQKTSRLAQQERQYQHQIQTFQEREQAVRAFLSDPQKVAAWLQERQGFQDPNELLTAEQARKLLASESQRLREQTQAEIAHTRQEMQIEQMAQNFSGEITTTIKGLFESYPELKAVRNIEKLLREEVAQSDPATLDEAKALFAEAAKSRAEEIRSYFQTNHKQEVVAKTEKLRRGIEPPGGTGIMPKPAEEYTSLKDPRLMEAVMEDFNKARR